MTLKFTNEFVWTHQTLAKKLSHVPIGDILQAIAYTDGHPGVTGNAFYFESFFFVDG